MSNYYDEKHEQDTAKDAECQRDGHYWANYPDQRVCRRCGVRSSRGSDRCFNGHDWSAHPKGADCRRCGAHVDSHTRHGGEGW